jgi:alpha 1,6-mannosyltransferase
MLLHTDNSADACLKLVYGADSAFYVAYSALPLVVMKTDIWRYAILYAFGGIYSDIDTAANIPVHHWLPPAKDGAYWPPNGDGSISLTWDDCSLLTGLEVDEVFNQFVSVIVSNAK